jgi:hypothetical protein
MSEDIVNMPFERMPSCPCDPGTGPEPTKQRMMECKLAGGPCSFDYHERNPKARRAKGDGEG